MGSSGQLPGWRRACAGWVGQHGGVQSEWAGVAGAQIEKMREVVELPMLHPEKFVQLGIDPPKGVLCYGPPGAPLMRSLLLAAHPGAFAPRTGAVTCSEDWSRRARIVTAALAQAESTVPLSATLCRRMPGVRCHTRQLRCELCKAAGQSQGASVVLGIRASSSRRAPDQARGRRCWRARWQTGPTRASSG